MCLKTDTILLHFTLHQFQCFVTCLCTVKIYQSMNSCIQVDDVSDHLRECNFSIDFDHLDILASDTNKFRCLIKEGLLIKRDQPH